MIKKKIARNFYQFMQKIYNTYFCCNNKKVSPNKSSLLQNEMNNDLDHTKIYPENSMYF